MAILMVDNSNVTCWFGSLPLPCLFAHQYTVDGVTYRWRYFLTRAHVYGMFIHVRSILVVWHVCKHRWKLIPWIWAKLISTTSSTSMLMPVRYWQPLTHHVLHNTTRLNTIALHAQNLNSSMCFNNKSHQLPAARVDRWGRRLDISLIMHKLV